MIRRHLAWHRLDGIEIAMLHRIDWFNHRPLREPIGNIPPAEAEASCYAERESRTAAV